MKFVPTDYTDFEWDEEQELLEIELGIEDLFK